MSHCERTTEPLGSEHQLVGAIWSPGARYCTRGVAPLRAIPVQPHPHEVARVDLVASCSG